MNLIFDRKSLNAITRRTENMNSQHVTFADKRNDTLYGIGSRDELVAMEENYNSIELGVLNSTDDALTRAIFQVQRTLLNHRPLYLQISKNEFAALLLKALGPTKLSSSVVNDLFSEVDMDDDGLLSAEELARYMVRIEQRRRTDMYEFFYERLVHASFLGSVAFLGASTLSITKNLFVRFYLRQHSFVAIASQFVVWLSLVGSVLFIWGALHTVVKEMLDTAKCQPFSSKVRLLVENFTTISQLINMFWVLGSISYVAEQWLIGGICYLVGGVLAFPSLYKSTLAELIQNHQLVSKLRTTLDELELVDEETGSNLVQFQPFMIIDELSTNSDLTEIDVASKVDRKIPYQVLHKRLRSDSNVVFVLKDVHKQMNDSPAMRARHKRAPTCPPDVFKRTSLGTLETESMTDTERSLPDVEVSTWKSLLGKDISFKGQLKHRANLECYDVFVSFCKEEPDLERSFRVIKRLSQSDAIDMKEIRQMASEETALKLRQMAFRKLLCLPSFYISIAYAIGGLMFTIGECQVGFSPSAVQNIYLVGSSLYFCGSAGILYRAWMNVSDEWDLLQESRMALHAMTYPDGTDEELELEQFDMIQLASIEVSNGIHEMKNE